MNKRTTLSTETPCFFCIRYGCAHTETAQFCVIVSLQHWLNGVFFRFTLWKKGGGKHRRFLQSFYWCYQWLSTLTGLHNSPRNLMNIFRTIKPFLKSYFACIQSNHYNANETGGMVNNVWMRKWIRKPLGCTFVGPTTLVWMPVIVNLYCSFCDFFVAQTYPCMFHTLHNIAYCPWHDVFCLLLALFDSVTEMYSNSFIYKINDCGNG